MHTINVDGQFLQKYADTKILSPEHNFPLLIERRPVTLEPAQSLPDLLLEIWAADRDWLERKLIEHGALWFRGFEIGTQAEFQTVTTNLRKDVVDYVDGNSPRTKLGEGVYTSTEYPPQYSIALHNELSYSARWPARLFFGCVVEPSEGGETPLVSSRTLLMVLPPKLVEEFRAKGVRYIRNLHGGDGFGKSWQQTFETNDGAVVEEFVRSTGAEITWNPDGSITIVATRSATAFHPATGDEVWFNQADLFHPSTLPREIYESLTAFYEGSEDQLPENVDFGDGTPIPLEYLETIRETTRQHIVSTRWQQGDLLMVDNMLVAHGRTPFAGNRKILVAMSS